MYIFIINPTAGNGRAKRIFSKIIHSSVYQSIRSQYFFTAYKGHAEEIIRNISESNVHDITGIIVIGGDGTLHEVVNGLTNRQIPVSLIPGGSGNDFARGCSIIGDPISILQRMIDQKNPTTYWLGEYELDHLSNQNKRYFANSIGFGFDAKIAETVNRSFYKKIFNTLRLGKLSYIIALIQMLISFKPMTVEIEVDGQSRTISGCWMITITNHPYYGGGMKIIPFATIQPRKFPMLTIQSISRFKILSLFLTVFTGNHIHFKEVEVIEATRVKITSACHRNITFQADGETGTCCSCVISKQNHPIWVKGSTTDQINKKVTTI